jgi:FkbM family methyltransferase
MPRATIEFSTPYGHSISAIEEDMITRKILRHGIYDGQVLDYLTRLLAQIDQAVVLDVGANIGNHALAMSTQSKHVYCFEPLDEVYEVLKHNVDANQINNISCINEALSDRSGEQVFYINTSGNLGASSLEYREHNKDAESTNVKIRLGDDMMSSQGISTVNLIKIDVEGHELSVLNGLSKTIAEQQPIIVMEWNERAAARRLLEADIFNGVLQSYSAFALGSNYDRGYWEGKALGGIRRKLTRLFRRKQVQLYDFNTQNLYRNVLLVPAGKEHLISAL